MPASLGGWVVGSNTGVGMCIYFLKWRSRSLSAFQLLDVMAARLIKLMAFFFFFLCDSIKRRNPLISSSRLYVFVFHASMASFSIRKSYFGPGGWRGGAKFILAPFGCLAILRYCGVDYSYIMCWKCYILLAIYCDQ